VTDKPNDRVLCVVVCGAGPASEVAKLVRLAQEAGWVVNIIATAAALPFLDVPALEELTGYPVRSEYRPPGEPRSRSAATASAIIVAPATYNTINKLALGISDNYALGVLGEALGMRVPVVILPFVNSALAGRRPFANAVEWLREEGVRVLLGEGEWEPHPPGAGSRQVPNFPWAMALGSIWE
jgi:phosphopantothenoylcysteine synthetase/decarboxylase